MAQLHHRADQEIARLYNLGKSYVHIHHSTRVAMGTVCTRISAMIGRGELQRRNTHKQNTITMGEHLKERRKAAVYERPVEDFTSGTPQPLATDFHRTA